MQLLVVFTKCHRGQLYLKSQKWLIWREVTKTWIRKERIPCSESIMGICELI